MVYKVINNGTTAEIKFYGIISSWFNGADDYTRTLAEIESKGIKNVVIRTHCYGGSVFEGFAIWTANKSSKLNIEFIVDGIAASMMPIVMMSGKKITMSSVAKIMIHAPRDGQGGTSKQLFETAKLLKSMEKDFVNIWITKTKQTAAEAAALLDGNDYWFDAEKCKELGFADAILTETLFTTDVAGTPDAGTPIETIYNRYTAVGTPQNFNHNTKNSIMDKQAIINSLGLKNVTAESTDAQILAAIDAQKQEAATAEQARVVGEATAMIDAKEKELNTKFLAEQRTAYIGIATAAGNCEALKVVLASIAAVPNITSMLSGETKTTPGANATGIPAERANSTWAQWEKEDQAGLTALEETNIEAFKKLYNAEFPNNKAQFQ